MTESSMPPSTPPPPPSPMPPPAAPRQAPAPRRKQADLEQVSSGEFVPELETPTYVRAESPSAYAPESAAVPPAPPLPSPSPSPSPSPTPTPTPTPTPNFDPGHPEVAIATPHSDDPWAPKLDDQLGVSDEAKAFARLAAARDFSPPLAIGVFGDWGSGKSFFMRLVHAHIALLAEGKTSPQAPEAEDTAFHRNIVQVRFNAWHYAETNLWASLVDHLFTELDRWIREKGGAQQADAALGNLSTARALTLEAAEELVRRRREQRDAIERLQQAELALNTQRRTATVSAEAYWEAFKAALGDPAADAAEVRAFKNSLETLGLGRIEDGARDLERLSCALADEAGRARLLGSSLLNQFQKWRFVGLFVLAVFVAPLVVMAVTGLLVQRMPSLGGLHEGILALGGALAGLSALGARVLRISRAALGRLEKSKAALDAVVEARLQAPAQAVKDRQSALTRATADVEEAKALVDASSDRLARATLDYASGTGAGRLIRFVRARAADGQYARHLSLVASVRKDFEELAAGVAAVGAPVPEAIAREQAAFRKRIAALVRKDRRVLTPDEIRTLVASAAFTAPPAPAFERIVLYIDDLDRCAPDKVVEVLQAVHLLLTFELFVVLVAVDVRWIRKSLAAQYPALLVADRREDGADPAGPAGPADRARDRDAISASDYLEKIFQVPYWVRPLDAEGARGFLQHRLIPSDQPGVPPALVPVAPPLERLDTRTLSIDGDESRYMNELAPFIGLSPRRVLRFMNVYRLVKAGLTSERLTLLSSGDYRALMTLLAVATGSPDLMPAWTRLLEGAVPGETVETLRSRLPMEVAPPDATLLLSGALNVYQGAVGPQAIGAVDALKRYARTAQRYSFTGR
jgi:hypothetical protein